MDTWILLYQSYLPSTGQRMFYSHFPLENQPEISGSHLYYDYALFEEITYMRCLGSWSVTFGFLDPDPQKYADSLIRFQGATYKPKPDLFLSKHELLTNKRLIKIS